MVVSTRVPFAVPKTGVPISTTKYHTALVSTTSKYHLT
jgi:hypothetical protein